MRRLPAVETPMMAVLFWRKLDVPPELGEELTEIGDVPPELGETLGAALGELGDALSSISPVGAGVSVPGLLNPSVKGKAMGDELELGGGMDSESVRDDPDDADD